ncbi:MAG: fibrinogen-like YCDxxxxGGGW domain-containing protein [Myxococcota bacterium]
MGERSCLIWSCVVVMAVTATSCVEGAACQSHEDCPAPQSCDGSGRCRSPATSGTSSSSGGPASSCLGLLQSNPALAGQDGLYTIQPSVPKGNAAATQVWCDMTVSGGGWTLVARSVVGEQVSSWGWLAQEGAPDDDNKPYSLGVNDHVFTFSEVLVGAHATGKTWTRAYRMALPADFLEGYTDSAVAVGAAEPVVGDCDPRERGPGELPFMLAYAGYTHHDNTYFFRDNDQRGWFGLHSDGWVLSTATNPCTRSGELESLPGMIMVR